MTMAAILMASFCSTPLDVATRAKIGTTGIASIAGVMVNTDVINGADVATLTMLLRGR